VADEPRPAWQPFTFGGVAAFASSKLRRLLLMQLLVAIVTSASITWFVAHSYGPIITQTISKLPETAAIDNGALVGFDDPITAETKFLSVEIDTSNDPQFSETADLDLEFQKNVGRACSLLRSLLGCVDFNYPHEKISLARSHWEPWWGARQPLIWMMLFIAGVIAMFISWAMLATVLMIFAKVVAWFADRQLTWWGTWKLCSAGLMVGALVLALAVRLYDWRAIDLIALAVFYFGHLAIDVVYAIGSPFKCAKVQDTVTAKNPFLQ
jgi:hypothetical protein